MVYLGMRRKKGYRYYLDVGKVKGYIKIFNDNCPSLYKSKLSKWLRWGMESIGINLDRKKVWEKK